MDKNVSYTGNEISLCNNNEILPFMRTHKKLKAIFLSITDIERAISCIFTHLETKVVGVIDGKIRIPR